VNFARTDELFTVRSSIYSLPADPDDKSSMPKSVWWTCIAYGLSDRALSRYIFAVISKEPHLASMWRNSQGDALRQKPGLVDRT
jgi:hypothetical protein